MLNIKKSYEVMHGEKLSMTNNLVNFIKTQPKELFFRILTTLLSMLILPHTAIVMFAVYMSQNHFFSYDLFSEGLFGLKIFFAVSAFMILFMGIALTGSVVLLVGKACNKQDFSLLNELKNWWWILLIVNILITLALITSPMENNSKIYLFVLSFIINIHLGTLIYAKAKVQFLSFLVTTFIVGYSSTLVFAKEASNLLSLGLDKFQIGGLNTSAEVTTDNQVMSGHLILISPEYIYIKDKNGTVTIFPMNNVNKVSVKRSANVPKNDKK